MIRRNHEECFCDDSDDDIELDNDLFEIVNSSSFKDTQISDGLNQNEFEIETEEEDEISEDEEL